jgi:hypothetical protein
MAPGAKIGPNTKYNGPLIFFWFLKNHPWHQKKAKYDVQSVKTFKKDWKLDYGGFSKK